MVIKKIEKLYLDHDGHNYSVSQWSAKTGFPVYLIHKRLNAGWSVEEALKTPLYGKSKKYDFKGDKLTIQELMKYSQVSYRKLYSRLNALGWKPEEAILDTCTCKCHKED